MDMVEYMKQPELVAKIQNYFGVRTEKANKDSKIEDLVTNKYWYYLFVFGTALGDELFYTSFIPFWFWNVDGAVGRRVVLVWAIVMYIGKCKKIFQ